MTFADLVEEVRQLPVEAKLELRHVIDDALTEEVQNKLSEGHAEALEEFRAGKLKFTSNAEELIRWLETE